MYKIKKLNEIETDYKITINYLNLGKMAAMGSDPGYRPGGGTGGINTAEVVCSALCVCMYVVYCVWCVYWVV